MADTKISALSAASSAVSTHEYPVNEAGTTKKVTAAQLTALVNTSPQWTGGGTGAGSWPTLANGSLLSSPAANTIENDGTAWYRTLDTTNGRTQDCNQTIFRLTADGTTRGSSIADFFADGGSNALPTVTNGVYELCYYLWYTKTTAGTITWTLTNTQTYTNLAAEWYSCPVGGIGSTGSMTTAGIDNTTTAAAALPVTGTITTATQQFTLIRAIAECGTAGNIRLRVTCSAGTVTPRRGCYYTARRLFAGNVGTFAA